MSGRPKRKQSRKNAGTSKDDEEVIDVDGEFYTCDDNVQSKKRSRDGVSTKNDDEDQSLKSSLLNTHPHSQLPSYLSEAFSDLYAEDGLVVMGRGLGWLGLLCSFVRYYVDTEDGYAAANINEDADMKQPAAAAAAAETSTSTTQRKPPLIFVLNLRENERQILLSTLSSWGTPTNQLPTIITSEEVPASERSALYARGGVFVITSRILIVDLLQGTAKSKDIEGMLVAHAEKVVGEKSMDAFILRIFRSQRYFMDSTSNTASGGSNNNNRVGFIKAFTDDPASLVSGFAKIDKTLKSLQVQRLFLYPRFHASVAEELERQPPTVIELQQPLSDKMKQIQDCLAASIRACIRDLRQKCPQLDLFSLVDAGAGSDKQRKRKRGDEDYMTNYTKGSKGDDSNENLKLSIQQCCTTNFSYVLNRQLEGYTNLSWEAKQCIEDLKTLGKMFHQLIEYGKWIDVLKEVI